MEWWGGVADLHVLFWRKAGTEVRHIYRYIGLPISLADIGLLQIYRHGRLCSPISADIKKMLELVI